jgi:hypothetical protein
VLWLHALPLVSISDLAFSHYFMPCLCRTVFGVRRYAAYFNAELRQLLSDHSCDMRWRKMTVVSLNHTRATVPERFGHNRERHTFLNQYRRVAVPQRMEADRWVNLRNLASGSYRPMLIA